MGREVPGRTREERKPGPGKSSLLFLLSDHPAQISEDALCGPPVAARAASS